MVLKFALVFCVTVAVARGLRCWECSNAPSNKACLENGRLRVCGGNERSCQNTIRVSNGKMTLFKSCKQAAACKSNMRQNGPLAAAWAPIQCTMQPHNTVCRCCCSSNRCNEFAFFCRGDTLRANFERLQEEVHPCGKPLCNNVGRCHKKGRDFKCACNPGFEGRQCQFRKARSGGAGGLLLDEAGVRGLDSDVRSFSDLTSKVDINECEGINDGLGNCRVRGSRRCENTIGSFICHCKKGYVGLLCEETIEEHSAEGHIHVDPVF